MSKTEGEITGSWTYNKPLTAKDLKYLMKQ